MSRNHPRALARHKRIGGASLVTAIFLLVVLAGMAAAMVNLSTGQHAASAMDVRGARAYQAARAGAEWGLYQQLQLATCNATTSLSLPAPTLSAFTVTVQCARTATPAAGAGASPAAAIAGTLTNNSTVVTTINIASLLEGMRVSGVGIAPGTRIAAIDTVANTLTLTIAATAGGGQPLTFRSALDRWRITSTACNEPRDNVCPNPAPSGPDYVQRKVQLEF